jgi:hypothetical protein
MAGIACSEGTRRVTSSTIPVAPFCRVLVLLSCTLTPLSSTGCKAKIPAITAPFTDDFERAEPGAAWHNTGAPYQVVGGKLNVSNAYNHPLWLRKKLPADVVVEIDVMSKSPQGDLKLELFGDGESFDADKNRYDPTGYVFVFGGWGNALSIIGRLGEHDDAVKARRPQPPAAGEPPPPRTAQVVPGRTYHFTITRKGGQIDWKIDGEPYLSWTDPEPLSGDGHAYLGVNDWESDVYFDNLAIRPL